MFQFQYGAINTKELRSAYDTLLQFQFQYGAINTRSRLQLQTLHCRFNSNMVL